MIIAQRIWAIYLAIILVNYSLSLPIESDNEIGFMSFVNGKRAMEFANANEKTMESNDEVNVEKRETGEDTNCSDVATANSTTTPDDDGCFRGGRECATKVEWWKTYLIDGEDCKLRNKKGIKMKICADKGVQCGNPGMQCCNIFRHTKIKFKCKNDSKYRTKRVPRFVGCKCRIEQCFQRPWG